MFTISLDYLKTFPPFKRLIKNNATYNLFLGDKMEQDCTLNKHVHTWGTVYRFWWYLFQTWTTANNFLPRLSILTPFKTCGMNLSTKYSNSSGLSLSYKNFIWLVESIHALPDLQIPHQLSEVQCILKKNDVIAIVNSRYSVVLYIIEL